MQFNIIFKTIFEYIHKKFRFVHTNTFCKYRKKLRASPRMHLVNKDDSFYTEKNISDATFRFAIHPQGIRQFYDNCKIYQSGRLLTHLRQSNWR